MSCQNGIIREYRINVTEVETGRVLVFNSTSTTLTLSSLHPYYTYQCIVSAYTVAVGPYTDIFTVVTPEDGMYNGSNCIGLYYYFITGIVSLLHTHSTQWLSTEF